MQKKFFSVWLHLATFFLPITHNSVLKAVSNDKSKPKTSGFVKLPSLKVKLGKEMGPSVDDITQQESKFKVVTG